MRITNLTEKQADDLMRLRKYLQRNWRYIPSPQMRGFQGYSFNWFSRKFSPGFYLPDEETGQVMD